MIKKHYTGMERRAENIIWNAAGRYDFDPPFMAFEENGRPDLYMNLILGLAFYWLDMDALTDFFARYAGYHKAEEFDALLWLGIENCLYEKELPHRPALARLRRQKAEQFFAHQQTLSRQQMMLQSMLIYDQEEARWSEVLQKKRGVLTAREQRLARQLQYPGALDTEGLMQRMRLTLQEFFHYTVPDHLPSETAMNLHGMHGQLLKRLLHREDHYRDTLIVRNGTAQGDEQGSVQSIRATGDQKRVQDYESDLAYIKESLGESILSGKDLRMLENNLCIGVHANCRLWVTDGRTGKKAFSQPGRELSGRWKQEDNTTRVEIPSGHSKESASTETIKKPARPLSGRDARELEKVQQASLDQAKKNTAWLHAQAALVTSSIRRLSARMDEVLSGYEQALPERSKAGKLCSQIAWRLPLLQDPDVFLRAGEETERAVSLDILLDASASRLNYQEQLAGEAYIIAKACQAVRVRVQVECFRSLRGFTVLQILKDRKSQDCRPILRYFAGGWNRDGLGLRLASNFLPEKTGAGIRILLILTDASPNDSTRIPAPKGGLLEEEYQGRAAILDAKNAVAALRKDNVKTAAVFLGPTLYMENLHTIYGKDCVRIHRIEQLDEAVADLLEQILREQK